MAGDADLAKDVRHHYEDWFTAVEKGDLDSLAVLIDEDFHYVDIFGEARGKDAYLEMVRGIPAGEIGMSLVDIEASRHATVVIAKGTYVVEGALASGKDISSRTRFTAVWVEEGSTRLCLVHHATRIA